MAQPGASGQSVPAVISYVIAGRRRVPQVRVLLVGEQRMRELHRVNQETCCAGFCSSAIKCVACRLPRWASYSRDPKACSCLLHQSCATLPHRDARPWNSRETFLSLATHSVRSHSLTFSSPSTPLPCSAINRPADLALPLATSTTLPSSCIDTATTLS